MFSELIARRGLSTPWDGLIAELWPGDIEMQALVKAIIATESAWDPSAINPRDPSYGLMQVMPASAGGAGPPGVSGAELLDPETNIRAGSEYLRALIARYGRGALSDVIAAYNAGRARRGPDGRYINQAYVDEVQTYHAWYLTHWPASAPPPTPSPEPTPPPDEEPPVVLAGLTVTPWIAAALLAAGALMLAWARR